MTDTDSETERLDRLRAALRSEPLLGPQFHPDRLEFDADGALIVAGAVESVAAKKRALERLAALLNGRPIVDRLHVTPAAPMGDAQIRAHLRDAFSREPAFTGHVIRQMTGEGYAPHYEVSYALVAGDPATAHGQIDIEVRDGIVTLNGHVPGLASQRLAGAMAWWVPGVRDVINGLEVRPPEDDAPIRIEEAVRLILERDPYIDASQIRVGVRHRTVRLTGIVRSESLRAMAERDAWYCLGVDEVVNAIEVEP